MSRTNTDPDPDRVLALVRAAVALVFGLAAALNAFVAIGYFRDSRWGWAAFCFACAVLAADRSVVMIDKAVRR